jgi:demethylmenaquinone methyltransferase/2-methoxy-6-polyprenyl-1,4-benzoquinol methylase
VKTKNQSHVLGILPVSRTKEEAKRTYDKISRYYNCLAAPFERKYAEMALELLSIGKGETVLEIGFGTGHCLKRIVESVGPNGKTYGIDISTGMMEISKKRLKKADLEDRVGLFCGDAASLPLADSTFNAVFMSFTLELFDTPEIPKVLEQIHRVLKPEGRLAVVSISKENGESIFLRLYEWTHSKWPKYVDCRPIYVEQSLIGAGYQIKSKEKVKVFRLPAEIIVAVKAISGNPVWHCRRPAWIRQFGVLLLC